MGRVAVLNDEQVFVLRNDALGVTLKEYSDKFGVSIPTLINAKKGRGPYTNWFLSKDIEDALVEKYFQR